MTTLALGTIAPRIAADVFVAPDAWLIGDVEVASDVSIFFGAVLRGDILPIIVGRGSNIQEHVVIHTSHGMTPAIVGSDVTVGHRAIIHGCTVEDRCIIGMGATILDKAVIGSDSIIGAHTLVPKGVIIPPGSLVMGTPARVVRQLSEDERRDIVESAAKYRDAGSRYRAVLAS